MEAPMTDSLEKKKEVFVDLFCFSCSKKDNKRVSHRKWYVMVNGNLWEKTECTLCKIPNQRAINNSKEEDKILAEFEPEIY